MTSCTVHKRKQQTTKVSIFHPKNILCFASMITPTEKIGDVADGDSIDEIKSMEMKLEKQVNDG